MSLEFWNKVANQYDGLYTDRWSKNEDSLIVEALAQLPLPKSPKVLDLGCGNGLALRLLQESGYIPDYLGVDFAHEMLRHLWTLPDAQQPKSVETTTADLEIYTPPHDWSPDLVISTY